MKEFTPKRSALKGKNLLPVGANSFLLEQIPFQKGGNFDKVTATENVPKGFALKGKNLLHWEQICSHWEQILSF